MKTETMTYDPNIDYANISNILWFIVIGGDVWDVGGQISKRSIYEHGAIKKVKVKSSEKRQFNIGLLILWFFFLVIILGFLIGPIGAMIGLIASIALSWPNERTYMAKVKYVNGDSVKVTGSMKRINGINKAKK